MQDDVLGLLACPKCRAMLRAVAGTSEALFCSSCGQTFPRTEDVWRLMEGEGGDPHAARTFGAQWRQRAEGHFERGTLYGLTAEQHLGRFLRGLGLRDEDLRGRRILDAGRGTALLANEVAPLSQHVLAVDLTAEMGADADRPLHTNLTLAQGDVLQLPARSGAFDVVWSAGEIHTTPDPERGHQPEEQMLIHGRPDTATRDGFQPMTCGKTVWMDRPD